MSDDLILEEFQEEGRLVSLAEVKEMLTKAQESREELTYEQKIALEHSRRFSRIDAKTAAALVKDLRAAHPAMEEKFAVRISDLLPQHPDDVQGILQKARLDLSEDDCEAILDIVDKHYVA
jgi:DNA-directed RNA polymerase subunit F